MVLARAPPLRARLRFCRARALCSLSSDQLETPKWPKGTRWRARVLYDGEDIRGSQIQPNARTAAGLIEKALSKRFNHERINLVGASRTDSGVHARGQAVHFDVPLEVKVPPTPAKLEQALNSMLPPDVRIIDCELAPEIDDLGRPWHAMRWSTGKLYSYRLQHGGQPDPLLRRQRHHTGWRPLDTELMEAGARHLVGRIDCAALANRRNMEALPIDWPPDLTHRVIRSIDLVDEGPGLLRFDFHLQSALYKMVRNMVGLLLLCGRGRLDPDDIPGLLATRNRNLLPAPAPAHGLTLESVYYSHGWDGKYDHPLHRGLLCGAPGGELLDECRVGD